LKRNLTTAIEAWVAGGLKFVGQLFILSLPEGGYELRHAEDADKPDLDTFHSPSKARSISFFDDAGEYRPLKTAPNLQHGWRLVLKDAAELRAALDHFYPAMTAVWLSHLDNALTPVALRDTLNRQTGMYAATKRLQDEEGQELVGRACAASSCTKRILWNFGPNQPLTTLEADKLPPASHNDSKPPVQMPLLCHEACNILVAACREVVKKRERAAGPPPDPSAAHPTPHPTPHAAS